MEDRISVPPSFENRDFWNDLLDYWLSLLEKYERVCRSHGDPDLAYWHVEKSLTGLLGAAAWSVKGWSLEEFSTRRGDADSESAGHGDLWLGRNEAKATVEAKMCWIDHRVLDLEKALSDKLNEAQTQLFQLEKDSQFGRLMSVCYVVPWYTRPRRKGSGIRAIMALERLSRAAGWATARYTTAADEIEEHGRKYPGVLLVAREEETSR